MIASPTTHQEAARRQFRAHAADCSPCRSGVSSHQREKFCDDGTRVFKEMALDPHSAQENLWWLETRQALRGGTR